MTRLINLYGLTENSVWAMFHELTPHDIRWVSCACLLFSGFVIEVYMFCKISVESNNKKYIYCSKIVLHSVISFVMYFFVRLVLCDSVNCCLSLNHREWNNECFLILHCCFFIDKKNVLTEICQHGQYSCMLWQEG